MNYGKIINGIQQLYKYWKKFKEILFPKIKSNNNQMVLGKNNIYHVQKPSILKIRIEQCIAWLILITMSISIFVILIHVIMIILLILIFAGILLFFIKKGNLND